MKVIVSPKTDGYIVEDRETAQKIYTIRRPSFKTGTYQLINASKYKLYTLKKNSSTEKPSFVIGNNGVVIMKATCNTMFLDPEITVKGKNINGDEVNFKLISKDRHDFDIIHGDEVCGYIKTKFTVSKELQYSMKCDDKYFDDYTVFFPVIIDMSYGQLNRENLS